MTRILRLLLIAAIALPYCGNAAAQESEVIMATPKPLNMTSEQVEQQNEEPVLPVKTNKQGKASQAINNIKLNNVAIMSSRGDANVSSYMPKGATIRPKAEKVTVTPPETANIELWDISTTWKQYQGTGWVEMDYYPNVLVAIDGNDIYIAGLCAYLPDAWVKGTINGNTVKFPTGQYYGSITTSDTGDELDLWFIGQNSSDELDNVYFDYDTNTDKLSFSSNTAFICDARDPDNLAYYSYHSKTVIQKPFDLEEVLESTSYSWPINVTNPPNTSTLDETATDPDQIIAMLREVYTNQKIPGNLTRGYSTAGAAEGAAVNYGGVGTITRSNSGNYSYDNGYGWDIPGTIKTQTSGYYTFASMNPEQYKPFREGVTLILLEMVDDFDNTNVKTTSTASTPYLKLRDYISKSIKSAKIVTEYKRTGEDLNAGTLFKIDCDKMNKFYFIAKGQLRWLHNSYFANPTSSSSSQLHSEVCDDPCFIYYRYDTSYYNKFYDGLSYQLFYNMFEEFSPVANDASSAKGDIYQDLVSMNSFAVEHDCMGVAYQGHQFMMYGDESNPDDCQDVRDLMFFVPDYRMMKWDSRDPSGAAGYQKFQNYNTTYAPTLGLFVIHQNEIPEGTIVSSDLTTKTGLYKHQLSWKSNLDDFLPDDEQEYELWEVVVDKFGIESYVPVYYRNEQGQYKIKVGEDQYDWVSDTTGHKQDLVPIVLDRVNMSEFSYSDVYVDMKAGSQIKTYVIRGRDKGHFLSLQMSNQEEIVIPGLDANEKVRLIGATYYSRFNPDNEKNCYSNKLEIKNTALGLKVADLSNTLNFYRSSRAAKIENGNVVTDANGNIQYDEVNKELFATGSVNGTTLTITLQEPEDLKDEFPVGKTDGNTAGYHANGNLTFTITTNESGYVNFGDLYFWDNFTVNVSKNAHPLQYLYKMEIGDAYSNDVRVPVYKTDSKINGVFSIDDVNNDTNGAIELPENPEFSAQIQLSSKTEILRYDAYRWNEKKTENDHYYIIDEVGIDEEIDPVNETEGDIAPTGIAGNQGTKYTVSMNKVQEPQYYYSASEEELPVVSTENPTNWAKFVDYYPNVKDTICAYAYAPVVELFTEGYKEKLVNNKKVKRIDYNTYGGPMQSAAHGKLAVSIAEPGSAEKDRLMSTYSWEKGGKTFCYYNVRMNIDTKKVPDGYDIYKIRAWRTVSGVEMGEEIRDLEGRGAANYCFEDITYPDCDKSDDYKYVLGSGEAGEITGNLGGEHLFYTGTFGAEKLESSNDAMTVKMKVRIYFTRKSNLPQTTGDIQGAPRLLEDGTPEPNLPADGKYYIVESEDEQTFYGSSTIITDIDTLDAREVAGVKYYNVAGIESDQPFKGVNIVVTRYTDGSVVTKKVIR